VPFEDRKAHDGLYLGVYLKIEKYMMGCMCGKKENNVDFMSIFFMLESWCIWKYIVYFESQVGVFGVHCLF